MSRNDAHIDQDDEQQLPSNDDPVSEGRNWLNCTFNHTVILMNCRSKAEAFARHLQTKLKSLGLSPADGGIEDDQNSSATQLDVNSMASTASSPAISPTLLSATTILAPNPELQREERSVQLNLPYDQRDELCFDFTYSNPESPASEDDRLCVQKDHFHLIDTLSNFSPPTTERWTHQEACEDHQQAQSSNSNSNSNTSSQCASMTVSTAPCGLLIDPDSMFKSEFPGPDEDDSYTSQFDIHNEVQSTVLMNEDFEKSLGSWQVTNSGNSTNSQQSETDFSKNGEILKNQHELNDEKQSSDKEDKCSTFDVSESMSREIPETSIDGDYDPLCGQKLKETDENADHTLMTGAAKNSEQSCQNSISLSQSSPTEGTDNDHDASSPQHCTCTHNNHASTSQEDVANGHAFFHKDIADDHDNDHALTIHPDHASTSEEVIDNDFQEEIIDNDFPGEIIDNDFPQEIIDNQLPKEVSDNELPEEVIDNDFPEKIIDNDLAHEEIDNNFPEEITGNALPEIVTDNDQIPPDVIYNDHASCPDEEATQADNAASSSEEEQATSTRTGIDQALSSQKQRISYKLCGEECIIGADDQWTSYSHHEQVLKDFSKLHIVNIGQFTSKGFESELTLFSPGTTGDNSFPQRVRRSSSLKADKTPPSTPNRKKVVRFADALGLDLEAVKTVFLDDLPAIPLSAYDDLQEQLKPTEQPASASVDAATTSSSSSSSATDNSFGWPLLMIVPHFQQPGSLLDFMDRVQRQSVCLESAFAVSGLQVVIVVRVLNLNFHKNVVIRYTSSEWLTFNELEADYVCGSCDGFSDKFCVTLNANQLEPNQRLVFAIRYSTGPTGSTQFWDNNNGQNYAFMCVVEDSSQSSTLTPPDESWIHFL